MEEGKNKMVMLIVATVILVVATILCFTVFNKGGNNENNGGNGNNSESKINTDNLLNMIPYVKRANGGVYPFENKKIALRPTEDIVVGALNYYAYNNCSTEETKTNCSEIGVDKIITIVKDIYNVDLTKEDIGKVQKEENEVRFYTYASEFSYQRYIYSNGIFKEDGEHGYIKSNNIISKIDENGNELIIHEKSFHIAYEVTEGKTYEILYADSEYKQEVTREEISYGEKGLTGGINLTKFANYGDEYLHVFNKIGENKYQYVSTNLSGYVEE